MKNKIPHSYSVGDLIYDGNIYDGMNTNMDDLEFYKRWLPKDKDAKILELCCGTGRLTLPLVQEGFNITGVDITASMLEQAQKKASDAGLHIHFIEADMRTFALPETYDLIFIPFNSIHHLYTNEELFQTFTAVKKHLKHDGVFVFDCFSPSIQFIVESEKAEKTVATYTTNDGRNVVIKERMRYERTTQINRIEWHYEINGEFDSVQHLDMRMYFPQEMDAYLKNNGFTIVHKYGTFEEAPFSDDSDKQIYICKTST